MTLDDAQNTPVYLVAPETADAHSAAGIVWFHWLETGDPTSNRTEFLAEAQSLAMRGVVSVLVDGTFPWHDSPVSTDHDVAAVQAEVAMLASARDLLTSQPAVDQLGSRWSATISARCTRPCCSARTSRLPHS